MSDTINEFGTPVSNHVCATCGVEFTICPAIPDGETGWENCLAPECDSYDSHRDAEVLFKTDSELAQDDKPVSLKMLRARKTFQETGKIT